MKENSYGMDDIIKFYIRIYDPNTIIIRLQCLDDKKTHYVKFIDNDKHKTILNNIFGDVPSINNFDIEEVTLNTVQNKEEMLKNKYTWNNAIIKEELDNGRILLFITYNIN